MRHIVLPPDTLAVCAVFCKLRAVRETTRISPMPGRGVEAASHRIHFVLKSLEAAYPAIRHLSLGHCTSDWKFEVAFLKLQ